MKKQVVKKVIVCVAIFVVKFQRNWFSFPDLQSTVLATMPTLTNEIPSHPFWGLEFLERIGEIVDTLRHALGAPFVLTLFRLATSAHLGMLAMTCHADVTK
jgi:hypothetical protein